MKKSLLFGSLLLLFFACQEDLPTDPKDTIDLSVFIGDYQIQIEHISEVHTFYDSVGNVIGMGIDTTLIADELFAIQLQDQSDTLLLNGLIKSFYADTRTEVQGVVSNDTIHIVHELPTNQVGNNFIKGTVWLEGDSIFLDYRWDTSDIWSAGALPERGVVIGKGEVKP